MPKRYSNKKELLSTWQQKINNQKRYYKELKDSGQVVGNFYDSAVYKNLDRRREKAEYRYDNRERISEQRKQYRERISDLEKQADRTLTGVDYTYEGTALDAVKGRGSKSDMDFTEVFKDRFFGELTINGEKKTYTTTAGFWRAYSAFIGPIFRRDSKLLMDTDFKKQNSFDTKTNTLYFSYEFETDYENEDE